MIMSRPTILPPGRRLAIGAALCTVLLAACSDGYPTEDAPMLDPARMTQAQLLAALNDLGEQSSLGKRWTFALHGNCELAVAVRNGSKQHRRVPLEGARVDSRSGDGVSDIRLAPNTGSDAHAVTVLQTRSWSDALSARSLLTHLAKRCDDTAGTTT